MSRYYDPGMFISKDGRKVPAKGDRPTDQLDLRGWVDDDTAYGYAGVFLIACELGTFTCSQVPGAEGERDATGRAHRARFANGYF